MQASCSKTYVAVIEDDESVCRSLSRLMRAAGIHPVAYASAESFLEDRKRPRFDILVVDVRLGRMSGLDLQEQLAAGGDPTPVIFITAFDDAELRERAERNGCVAYLRKTEPADSVLAAIHQTVQQPFTDHSSQPARGTC